MTLEIYFICKLNPAAENMGQLKDKKNLINNVGLLVNDIYYKASNILLLFPNF